jgi:hypothetical protein
MFRCPIHSAAWATAFLVWSVASIGQTTRDSFEHRVQSAIRAAIPIGAERWTNQTRAGQQWVVALRAATAEKLRTPQLLPSLYYPQNVKDGHVTVRIAWLEDVPTLQDVTLLNPATQKEFKIRIPDDALRTRREWSLTTVLFSYTVSDVPVEVTGTDPEQQLELRAADGQTAVVYPSVLDESKPIRTLEQRVESSIRRARDESVDLTNDGRVRREWIAAIRAATPERLNTPQLLPSLYFPKDAANGHCQVDVWWLEDKPTLRRVTLLNPATKKQFEIRIPDDDLELIRDRARFVILHDFSVADVPVEVAGDDPGQQLELITADGQRAPVFPSLVETSQGQKR